MPWVGVDLCDALTVILAIMRGIWRQLFDGQIFPQGQRSAKPPPEKGSIRQTHQSGLVLVEPIRVKCSPMLRVFCHYSAKILLAPLSQLMVISPPFGVTGRPDVAESITAINGELLAVPVSLYSTIF